jgi:spermidine synthase
MQRNAKWLLGAFFFLSGGSGLVLEVTWSKELSYILGNTLYAISTVVAAFMGGLALGSVLIGKYGDRFRRPLRTYGLLQLGISLCGIASIPLFRATQPVFRALYRSFEPGDSLFLLVRFLVVFGLMLVPVMLMGMTLPVVVAAYARSKRSYNLEAGTLYGVNTLGAVLGTLAAAFVLIPSLGILRTCIAAGLTDLVVAGSALMLDRRVGAIEDLRRAKPTESAVPAPDAAAPPWRDRIFAGWTVKQWTIGLLFGISGGVAMLYEVGWFRLLGLTMGPSVYAFAVMLAVYLIGIGLGSAAAAPWAERTRLGGVPAMAVLEGLLGWIGLCGLFLANHLPGANAGLFRWALPHLGKGAFILSQMGVAAILVLPPCLLMGALFPVVVRALREAGREVSPEATVGRLYVMNTSGGIIGSLIAGFLLLPALGVWRTLVAGGILSAAVAAALGILAFTRAPRLRWGFPLGVAVGAVVLIAAAPDLNLSLFNQGPYREVYRGGKRPSEGEGADQLIYQREGINTAVAVFRFYGSATLYVGGKPDASTNTGDLYTQLFLAHLPILFCDHPRSVAVVGYGSGTTVGAALTHPEVERVDALEIERAVIDASPYFDSINQNPFDDKRTRLVLEDGRIHLAYTDAVYDVITSEPSNPWMAGIANLFTADFYREVGRRLTPGGVFAQWIQNYDISADAFQAILGAMRETFPHLAIFQPIPGDFIVLAAKQPIAVPWEQFAGRFAEEGVAAAFHQVSIESPLQLGFFLVGPEAQALDLAGKARFRNTDDNAWLEHRMPLEMIRLAPSSGPARDVAADVFRISQGYRLRALGAMLPGVPMEDLVREIVRYPYLAEPNPMIPREFDDRWGELRDVQRLGLRAELIAMGEPDLARSIDVWAAQWEKYRDDRVAVSEELTGPNRADRGLSGETLERALSRAPDLPLALLLMGGALVDKDDLDGGEKYYRQVTRYPSSGAYYDALLGLAGIAWTRGDKDGALHLAEQAVGRNPYLANGYVMIARLLLSRDDPEGALRVLDEGLKRNPHSQPMEEVLKVVRG